MKACLSRRKMCLIPLLSAALLTGFCGATESTGNDDVVIGSRDELSIARRQWLNKELASTAYQAEAQELARLLGAGKLDDKEQQAVQSDLKREPDRAGGAFATLLNWSKCQDAKTRRGALRAIDLAGPSAKAVGVALGNSALAEPDKDTRKAAINTIRQRRDALALHTLLGHLAQASDTDGLGILDEKARDAALSALHDIGDRRAYEAILFYVTLELRTGYAVGRGVDTKYITNSGDVNAGGVGQTTVNLPIELPALELGSFQGMITVPAICKPLPALRRVTGEDFGKNLDKWRAWIAKQPDVKK